MSVLITGGTGFIGSYLTRELASRGESDIVLFNRSANMTLIPESIQDKVRFAKGDLSSWGEIFETVKKYNIKSIYHCGALLSESAENAPFKAYEVNTLGTWYVLEAARMFDVEKVLFVSTVASFGDHISNTVSNIDPQYPKTIYGVSKVSSERLGEYYRHKFKLNFRGVRFPSVIGPGRGPGGASAYSSFIFEKPVLGESYVVNVDEKACIPLLYIKDAVRALIELGEAEEDRLNHRMYNISGFSPTAGEIAKEIKKTIPQAKITFEPDQDMVDIINSWPEVLDDSEAKKDWNWENKYEIQKTIEDFKKELAW